MANLPDITTADVGIIAFWNAEDHKDAGVVDPIDCTGVFTNYSVYDNGLDGYKTLGSGRHFNCRVKNDGWCVAWIDRTNTFGYPNKPLADFGEAGYRGYYDILWSWLQYTANISSTLTTLSYIISVFEAALETSGDFTFVSTDVGHYCYEFPAANVITIAGLQAETLGIEIQTGYIQYTTGTSIYHSSVGVASRKKGAIGTPTKTDFEDNILLEFEGSGDLQRYASADLLAEGWMPAALTDYRITTLAYCGVAGATGYAKGSILIIWS